MTNLMDNSRSEALFFRHRAALDPAVSAAMTRGCWSRYSGLPARRICGASAAREGEAALADLAFIAGYTIVQSRWEIG